MHIVSLALLTCLSNTATWQADKPGSTGKPPPKAEAAIAAFFRGLTSDKKADQVKALDSVLPNKKDVETLFPRQEARLWPLFDASNKHVLEHVDEVAKQIKSGGAIKEVKVQNVRTDHDLKEKYAKVLKLVPGTVEVYEYVLKKERGASGGGAFVLVNGHWRFIKDLDALPEILESLPEQKKP
jgi:hypothetical protein